MPPLRIQLVKHADGGAVLRCVRPDGTTTWQRHDGAQGPLFPLHDLTHHAVETELGTSEGFFGLVARGWGPADVAGTGARGALPAAALEVERLVGWLDAERASGARWTAADYALREPSPVVAGVPVTDDLLARVRTRRAALFAGWEAVTTGRALELDFDPRPA